MSSSLSAFLGEIGRHQLLTPEQELMLGRKVQAMVAITEPCLIAGGTGPSCEYNDNQRFVIRRGERAKNQMITANLRLVVNLAKRYQGKGLDLLDLIQEGTLGLTRAVEKYDPTRGHRFSTYAYWWIRQGLNRALSTQSRTIRIPVNVNEKFFEAANTVLHYDIVRVFAWERTYHLHLISDLVRKMFVNASNIGYDDYLQAQDLLFTARLAHQEFMAANQLDALLTPSAPGEAPPIKTTGDSVFNRVWTSLGVPAIHLPVRLGPTGLPVGIQLTGRHWCDKELLATAAHVESEIIES